MMCAKLVIVIFAMINVDSFAISLPDNDVSKPIFVYPEDMIPDQLVPETMYLVFTCRAKANPPPRVTWYKNGEIFDSERVVWKKWRIKFPSIEEQDGGNYTCIVENQAGKINFTYSLRVHGKEDVFAPVFIYPDDLLPNIPAHAMQSISLKCKAAGNPFPNITWHKDGHRIDLENKKNVRFENWNIKFSEVLLEDDGRYKCVVENSLGSINYTFRLIVIEVFNFPPKKVKIKPGNLTIHEGQHAVFECSYVSDYIYLPIMNWVKYYHINNSYVDKNNNTIIEKIEVNSTYAEDERTLVLENVTFEDAGRYACIVENLVGSSEKNVWLTVLPRSKSDAEPWNLDLEIIASACGVVGVLLITVSACAIWYTAKHKNKPHFDANFPAQVYVKKRVVVLKESVYDENASNMPVVKVEHAVISSTDPESKGFFEYDLPFDPTWEVPREE